MANIAHRDFSVGELSPSWQGRPDLALYRRALATLRNGYVRRVGGVTRRDGTTYLGSTKSNGAVRLVPVWFDTDQAYILEFGDDYVRFWQDGELVEASATAWLTATAYTAGKAVTNGGTTYVALSDHTSAAGTEPGVGGSWPTVWYALTGSIYELPTVYGSEVLDEIQYQQSVGQVRFVHNSQPRQTLIRVADNEWYFTPTPSTETLLPPPDNATSTATAGSVVTWVVTAYSSTLGVESVQSDFMTGDTTPSGGSPFTQSWDAVTGATSYRVYKSLSSSVLGFVIEVTSTSWIDDGSLAIDYERNPPTESASFGSAGLYPGVIGAYQQRILLSGKSDSPDVVDASRSAAPDDFTVSNPLVDSDAIQWRQVGAEVQRIRHFIENGERLFQFTTRGEFLVEGNDNGVLSPVNLPNPRQISANGSAANPRPLSVFDSALYVQARGSIIRDLYPNQGGFGGTDLSLTAEHLVDGYTISDWAYQQTPDSVVWVVRSDGTLLSLTYVRDLGILGWARHDTDGVVENVACVPEGNTDAVYLVVRRTINSSTVRYLERMGTGLHVDAGVSITGANYATLTLSNAASGGPPPFDTFDATGAGGTSAWTQADVGRTITLTDGVATEQWEITAVAGNVATISRDGSTAFSNSDVFAADTGWYYSSIPGYAHLNGENVSVVKDGVVIASPLNPAYAAVTISGGVYNPASVFSTLVIGLPFVTDIETLDIDAAFRTLKDSTFNITTVGVHLQASVGPYCGPRAPDTADALVDADGNYRLQKLLDVDEDQNATTSPVTGYRFVNVESRYTGGGRTFMRQVDPVPLTVLAISPQGHFPRG